jgi:hypothetical protein
MPGTDTLLLDRTAWDLVLDANGNIAVASAPYSLAQDAASAIKTFLGECTWDTTLGVPYLTQIFSGNPSLAQVEALFVAAAESVPGVASAEVFLQVADDRIIGGQVQVTSQATGEVSAPVPFSVINPQGGGQ